MQTGPDRVAFSWHRRLLSVFRRDVYIIFCHTARPEEGSELRVCAAADQGINEASRPRHTPERVIKEL